MEAFGAGAPENHLGFIHLEVGVGGGQTRRRADRAVDVDGLVAGPADDVVMVVSDSGVEEARRSGWLNPADQLVLGEHTQGVVNRLARDRADFSAHGFGDLIRCAVRNGMHGSQDCKPLGGYLQPFLAQGFGQIGQHMLYLIRFWTQSRVNFASSLKLGGATKC